MIIDSKPLLSGEAGSLSMRSVLIAEDSEFISDILQDIFREKGFEIAGIATSGDEVLEMYERLKPDLISMDILMPGMDGLTAMEKIREMDLRQYNVISFATHALVSNELTGLVEPSLVLTPIDAENPANDGLLTASEIMKLDLDADMVLLSACNTASSSGVSNSEGLSGLANSFFQAGAKSLLVSYWSVISESAVDITTRMFSPTNTGRSYAHRHRNSVLELLKESEGTIKSHPSYWAPFSVIGVN